MSHEGHGRCLFYEHVLPGAMTGETTTHSRYSIRSFNFHNDIRFAFASPRSQT